ncbi:MAG: HAMP domain-containing histidine kinase [Planctomycetes bacterium]|nr:HAMP domain-containing histidine kinase [Planctomycetota bacterium]
MLLGAAVATLVLGGTVIWASGAAFRARMVESLGASLPESIALAAAEPAVDDEARVARVLRECDHLVGAAVYRQNPLGLGLVRGASRGDVGLPVLRGSTRAPYGAAPLATADGHTWLTIDVPISGAPGDALRVVRSLTDVDAAVTAAQRTAAAVLATAALLGAFAVDRVRRRTREFLRALARAMQLVTNERPGLRLDPVDGGELDLVARHFNMMTRALERSREESQRRSTELETRVQERTAELERANAALRTLDSAKDAFLANVSHELRTPLTSIVAASEILAAPDSDDPEMRREFVGIVSQEARRLLAMIEQVLEVVQLEARPVALTRTVRDLRVLAHRARDGGLARARAANIQLLLREPTEPVMVAVDEFRLLGVLDCLLDNAIKFSPGGGTVEVAVRLVDRRAELLVVDEGPGIPDDDAERVFEPFGQQHRSLTDKPKGMGLGLARARRIVQAHEGELDLERMPGFGACFVLRLPAIESRAISRLARESAASEARNGDAATIVR